MAWPKGKPTTGTARKRSDLEIAHDRLYLVGLLLKMGRDYPVNQAAEQLNAARERNAREVAQLLGKDEADVEAAGRAARLSPQTAARDVRAAIARVNEATDAVSAVFLDRMIEDVEADYRRTFEWEDGIWRDLEASRESVRTISAAVQSGRDPVPTQLVSQKGGGDAALWGRLLQIIDRRQSLREELMRLRVGRQMWPAEDGERTYAQALTGADTPEAAKAAAIELYEREVEALFQADALDLSPISGELARWQRDRARRAVERLGALRSFIQLPRGDGAERPAYEIIVSRMS